MFFGWFYTSSHYTLIRLTAPSHALHFTPPPTCALSTHIARISITRTLTKQLSSVHFSINRRLFVYDGNLKCAVACIWEIFSSLREALPSIYFSSSEILCCCKIEIKWNDMLSDDKWLLSESRLSLKSISSKYYLVRFLSSDEFHQIGLKLLCRATCWMLIMVAVLYS